MSLPFDLNRETKTKIISFKCFQVLLLLLEVVKAIEDWFGSFAFILTQKTV
jgi:hypothetical protein